MKRVELIIGNMRFKLRVLDIRLSRIVEDNIKYLTVDTSFTKKPNRFSKYGKNISYKNANSVKKYYEYLPNENMYMFNINNLKNILGKLGREGVTREQIHIKYDRSYDIESIDINLNENYILRDYQEEYVDIITKDNDKPMMLIDLQTGKGKALSNDTLVKVPNGWKPIGMLKEKDVVLDMYGDAINVIGVYPQGVRDLYRVVFEDGRAILSDLEHLWKVYLSDGSYRLLTTEDVIEYLNMDIVLSIDTVKPYIEHECSYHYNTGMYLHDIMKDNILSDGIKLFIAKAKTLTITELYSLLYGLYNKITNHGVDKVCDIDGSTILKIDVVNGELANFLTYVVRAVGGLCYNTYIDGLYKLTITFKKKLKISYVKYEKQDYATCIRVDSKDMLFVAGDHIVTHNSLISVAGMTRLKTKTAMLLLPNYIKKWVIELQEYTDIDEDEIYVVQGYDSLVKLLNIDHSVYKIIIFSIPTIRELIKNYKDGKDVVIDPQQLLRVLKVGLLVNDEVHQHFHSVFTIAMYLDPMRFIAMSATLDSHMPAIKKIYYLMFPHETRINNIISYHKYIDVYAVKYNIAKANRLVYKVNQAYNHIEFEKSILRDDRLLVNYLEMIKYHIDNYWIKYKDGEEKCVVFAAGVNMCTVIKNYLEEVYSDYTVNRFVEDDPYENIINGDIAVTTIGSGGTGLDIPKLTTIVQTISIGSLQANVQALGRLRYIKDKDVKYVYLYCDDIQDHRRLNHKRLQSIKDRVRSITNLTYYKTL